MAGSRGPGLAVFLAAGAMAVFGGASPEAWMTLPVKSVLGTGIPLVYHQDKISPMTVVGIFAPGGRAAVPEGLDGLAYLATRLTLEIPDEDKARDLMTQATRMTYLCEEDCSIVFIECLSENLEPALRLAGRIIQDPLMSGLRIGRAKELMELLEKAELDDAVVAARQAALKALFAGRGYGSSTYGTAESRKAIGRKDVLDFYRRHFTASGVFFTVVTDLDQAPVQALLEKHFAKFPEGGRPGILSPSSPAVPEGDGIRLTKDTKQTYVGRAYVLPAPSPDDLAKGLLLEVLIGKGPGSRLWGLRMDERLAYNVDGRLTWTRTAGVLEAFLESENAKSGQAAEALDRTLRALWEGGAGEAELEAAKAMAKTEFLRSIESKPERALRFGRFEVLGLGFERVLGLHEAVDGVTLEAFNVYIKTVLAPDKALRVTVGPTAAGDPGG
jgi:predicted Zn-dependent peptidase